MTHAMEFATAAPAEHDALGDILSHAFGFPREDVPAWFERAGHENIRVLRAGGAVGGGLLLAPMGQFFGGRAVPMTGVLGVGVAPERRGAGVGTWMMDALVRELRARGVALSALYPATVPLYRRAGYERAGARFEVAVAPRDLPHRAGRGLRVAALDAAGEGETAAVYRAYAARHAGFLDRGPYVWKRVNKPWHRAPRVLGVAGERGLEGYAVVSHAMSEAHDSEVVAHDLVATTPAAAERLLTLLGDYRSIAARVRWFGPASSVFTTLLPDRHHEVTLRDYWMLRVVDVARALAARGYPALASGELALEVDDDVVPENAGRWRLRVARGEATVERGGAGDLKLAARGLAALYAGHLSATALAMAGLAEGGPDALAAADALFAGPAPAMPDMF